MRHLALTVVACIFTLSGALMAQQQQAVPQEYKLPDPTPYGALIQPETLKQWLDVLASKEMEGRETGERGQQRAAAFIAEQFKAMGLPQVADRNTYFQAIQLKNESWTDIGLKVGDQEFKNRTDFYVFPAFNPDKPLTKIKEVVFVGYGVDDPKYSDYGKEDVKGKTVLFYNGEPLNKEGKSLITGTDFRSPWALNWQKKVQKAKEKGAVSALIVDNNFAESVKNNRKMIASYGWKPVASDADLQSSKYISNVFISPEVAAAILGSKAEKAEEAMAALMQGGPFKPVSIKRKLELRLDKEVKMLKGSNVIGFIEGVDPVLKNEYVFVTAHYDHLGMPDSSVVYYGADDNASGTCGVINIAKAFAEAKRSGIGPKRSVVCMLVSGEEKGLLGSKFYVDFPLFALSQTIVDVNIDMIGRVDEAHKGKPDYIYVIGSDRMSTDLHQISEKANQTYTKLELDYKYNAKDDPNHFYERSDHYNFAENGVPAIFYFNGTHPDYHRPTDTADKIDFNALAKRAQLAFYTAWDIANRPWRLNVDVKK